MELKFGPAPIGRMTTEVRALPKSVTPFNWKVSGLLAVRNKILKKASVL